VEDIDPGKNKRLTLKLARGRDVVIAYPVSYRAGTPIRSRLCSNHLCVKNGIDRGGKSFIRHIGTRGRLR